MSNYRVLILFYLDNLKETTYFLDKTLEKKCKNVTTCETLTRSYTGKMKISFISKMTVSEQFFSYGLLAYVAENGGFVGLFLGYSVLELRVLIAYFLTSK